MLAVSALGMAPGCGDDGTSDSGNDGPAPTSTSGSTGPATDEGGTTAAATTATSAVDTGDSGAMTGTDTSAIPDCPDDAMDQATCEATPSCVFMPELGGCIVDCSIIPDEATCTQEQGCLWYGDTCDFEPIA